MYTYVYIYIYIYIYCDEEIRHPHTFAGLWGKEVRHAGRLPTTVVTKNSGSGKAVSLQPSLLALGDKVMRESHLLLAMYASAERGRQRP